MKNSLKPYKEVATDLIAAGKETAVLNIKCLGPSKLPQFSLYEVVYIDQKKLKQISIIARDITEALGRLEGYLHLGIPDNVLSYMLNNKKFD